ncbi:hypothetical protein [Vulcanisaeta souniana]|uniref:Uncharacterized protein n=1 Tax=Vulcanisaeta souniana JCM 11219 TaxID=1293586 RepID=A0A830E4S7_9CREN|nr:hypothetical protein [Vulcanisaeta souniana]BDR92262.1 hypothetical protein Vsou_13550 [Vulcanisaeta souniana JCM 11219]GGI86325.1 hypothetical protein GCM10007112_24130 [Vulcanisaeta souniana JCM 11219]
MVYCNIEELDAETKRLHYEVLYRLFRAWLLGVRVSFDDVRRELGVGTSRFDKVLDRMEFCQGLGWIRCRRGSQGRNRVWCEPTLAGLLALAREGEYWKRLWGLAIELMRNGRRREAYDLASILSLARAFKFDIDIVKSVLNVIRGLLSSPEFARFMTSRIKGLGDGLGVISASLDGVLSSGLDLGRARVILATVWMILENASSLVSDVFASPALTGQAGAGYLESKS